MCPAHARAWERGYMCSESDWCFVGHGGKSVKLLLCDLWTHRRYTGIKMAVSSKCHRFLVTTPVAIFRHRSPVAISSHRSPDIDLQSAISRNQSPVGDLQKSISSRQSPVANLQFPITNHSLNSSTTSLLDYGYGKVGYPWEHRWALALASIYT